MPTNLQLQSNIRRSTDPDPNTRFQSSGANGNSYNKSSNQGNKGSKNNISKTIFMENYVKNFDINVSLSMDSFEKYENKLKEIESNSQLRKIYDSYVNIQDTNKPDDEKKLLVQILFAKTAYQESRKSQGKTLIPSGFAKFLNQMFDKINNIDRYKQFLEVFVAYHRYFNPEKK